MATKHCGTCKTTENLCNTPYAIRNGRLYYRCKSCHSKRLKAYYDKTKIIVYEHYGNKCACCGEDNILFLSIDHVMNDGYKDRWPGVVGRRSGYVLYSKIKTAGFPKAFQLLCMNCNYGKRMNKGTCPHIDLTI